MNEMRLVIISCLVISLIHGTAISQIGTSQTGLTINDTIFWEKIGETTIDLHDRYNEIAISKSEKYDSIRFSVTEPLTITDLEISFETGNNQVVKTVLSIDAIKESLPIELHSGERNLTKVSFSYVPTTGKTITASVQLWGIKNQE